MAEAEQLRREVDAAVLASVAARRGAAGVAADGAGCGSEVGRDERRARAGAGSGDWHISRLVRFGKRERNKHVQNLFPAHPRAKKNPGDAPPSPGFSFCPAY